MVRLQQSSFSINRASDVLQYIDCDSDKGGHKLHRVINYIDTPVRLGVVRWPMRAARSAQSVGHTIPTEVGAHLQTTTAAAQP